ncbi:endonuclease VII domain-containing protein [Streptomyces triticagri]|nr:endonuclease VII domain-containing protein [Streptomyces triticagri]
MSAAQNHRCAICGAHGDPADDNRLHIDHDHDSGLVRGLLCGLCNRGIGALRHDPETLRSAMQYLADTDTSGGESNLGRLS